MLTQAQAEAEKAQTFVDKIFGKMAELDARKLALDIDLEAADRAFTYAKQELNQKNAALAAAAAAMQTSAATTAPAASTGGFSQQGQAEFVKSIMQVIAQTFAETQDQQEFMQKCGPRMVAMAGGAAQDAGTAEPPAGPLQTAAAAPPGAPGGAARQPDGGEGRLQTRTSLKTAAVEEPPAAGVRKQQEAARQRKELRAADFEARRASGEAGAADGMADDSEATGQVD